MKDEKTFTYETRYKLDPQTSMILRECASLYGSISRHLFRDIMKKLPINTLKKEYLQKYGITARQFNACRVSIEWKISSVKIARSSRLEQLKEKISSLEKKVPKIKDKESKHQKTRKLLSLQRDLTQLEQDHKEGKVSLCFGGKKLFHAQFHLQKNDGCSFETWKESWKKTRNSEFFSLGSKDETSGNQS